jgi:hypothetical protein
MSEITQQTPTNNQLFTGYDISKIFLFGNKYRTVNIANATGSAMVLVKGTVIGCVGITHAPYDTDTSNQLPVGILAEDRTIANGDSADVVICNDGKVAEEKIVFYDTDDTLATIVSNRSVRDMLISNTLGIELVTTNELTADDNV